MRETAIVGAGSWGTALAALWSADSRPICLWGNDRERIARVQSSRENVDYLPGIHLAENVRATPDLDCCGRAELIVFVAPSIALRAIATRVCEAGVRDDAAMLSCTKGIEHGSGMRMSEILREIFPSNPIA